jgi:hypothetical protein
VLYPVEESRGYQAHGDLWSPGSFGLTLAANQPVQTPNPTPTAKRLPLKQGMEGDDIEIRVAGSRELDVSRDESRQRARVRDRQRDSLLFERSNALRGCSVAAREVQLGLPDVPAVLQRTGEFRREHDELMVLVSNTVLNLAHPNHMREALLSRRMGLGGK